VSGEPTFFAAADRFGAWLETNHATATALLVGFYKVGSGRPSMTWPQSVDEALRVGWIDGVRRRIDETAYSIRFTPRRPRSIWSAVNVARVEELTRRGRMLPAGIAAFEARTAERSGIYSFEQATEPALAAPDEARLRADPVAWAAFQAQPAWYRRAATWWVVSAKREDTRVRRFEQLLEASRAGTTVRHLTRPAGRG
jgi:uncharacterized protein YdeI (YjbR/CyaY-like superfamily)